MGRGNPPRFVVRTLLVTVLTVAFVLSAALLAVTFSGHELVRAGVADRLERSQRLLAALEERRGHELHVQAATLAESPTLKAALDTFQTELRTTSAEGRQELVATVARELDKFAARINPDVLAVRDQNGALLAVAGRRGHDWAETRGTGATDGDNGNATFVTAPAGVFRVAGVPVALQGIQIGTLELASALDDRYAQELSNLAGERALIVSGDRVIASTLPPATLLSLTPSTIRALAGLDEIKLSDSEYALRRLISQGDARVFVLESVDAAVRPALKSALRTLAVIAFGAFLLAAAASLWLARTIARPVDRLSSSLLAMTRSRDFDNPVPASGSSVEVDTLTTAFNTMMASVKVAEAEALSAYLGTIRALALALDARDPYTAGHSERVSALSLAIGRAMQVDAEQLEVLRLGALLHDIGKIGISDQILMKPSRLTPAEYEAIKQHPTVGARILRSIPYLAPHLPIVELHHERPDGRGYPHGLQGADIPLLARIVHVADAFDAMTSARAYRPALGTAYGLRELWRCAGTDFDAEVVQALAQTLPALSGVSGESPVPTAIPVEALSI
jgi:putative nucleotidyltransferase with HDIG domain